MRHTERNQKEAMELNARRVARGWQECRGHLPFPVSSSSQQTERGFCLHLRKQSIGSKVFVIIIKVSGYLDFSILRYHVRFNLHSRTTWAPTTKGQILTNSRP